MKVIGNFVIGDNSEKTIKIINKSYKKHIKKLPESLRSKDKLSNLKEKIKILDIYHRFLLDLKKYYKEQLKK